MRESPLLSHFTTVLAALALLCLFAASCTEIGDQGEDDDASDADDDQADDDDDQGDDDDDQIDDDDDDIPSGSMQGVFYDVGQGDALLLRLPRGATMLVDGGPNGAGDAVILPHLEQLGLERIDVLVLTHADADHVGGLDEVVQSIEINELWENGLTKDTYSWRDFDEAIEARNVPRRVLQRGDSFNLGGCAVLALNADQGFGGHNDNSIVLSIACEPADLLLTGDITDAAQAELIDVYAADLAADVVKVPHHGSADRDSRLAGLVQPQFAVISCGADNPYGHPAAATVTEWQAAGAAIYRTDQQGTISMLADESGIRLSIDR